MLLFNIRLSDVVPLDILVGQCAVVPGGGGGAAVAGRSRWSVDDHPAASWSTALSTAAVAKAGLYDQIHLMGAMEYNLQCPVPGTAVCFQPADQMMANAVAGSRSSFGGMGTPNMQQMLMPSDQSSSTDTLVAMLASYSPAASAALQGL